MNAYYSFWSTIRNVTPQSGYAQHVCFAAELFTLLVKVYGAMKKASFTENN